MAPIGFHVLQCGASTMGTWNVDATSEPGLLKLTLEGRFEVAEMASFAEAHNRTIDAFRGRDYKVWVDITKLVPLSQEAATVFEKAKMHSRAQKNFRGSAVLTSSATVALQHRRTSITGGVMDTELISSDATELREHLRRVNRQAG
jgi:hypothetical protein